MMWVHWRNRRIINKYILGTLSESDRRDFESHLSQCNQCQQKLAQEQQFSGKIEDSFHLMDGVWDKIQTQIDHLPETPPRVDEKETILFPVPNWRLKVAFVSIALLVLIGILWIYPIISQYHSEKITQILGPGVYYQSAGTKQWVKGKENISLKSGDWVKTDEFTLVSIRFGKKAQIWINRSSHLQLISQDTALLHLNQGEIVVSVKPQKMKVTVETPAGTVQVLGTEFYLQAEPNKRTIVTCLENLITFTNPHGQVFLQTGEQTIATPDSSPAIPKKVDLTPFRLLKTQFTEFSKLTPEEKKKSVGYYIQQGNQFYDQKEYTQAMQSYQTALYLDPDYFASYYGMGRTNKALGQYTQATVYFLQALARNTQHYGILAQLGDSYLELGDYPSGEKYLQQMVTKFPDNHAGWTFLGDALLLSGKLDSAYQTYQQALRVGAETCPDCGPRAHGGLAEIARQKKDYSTAKTELDKAFSYKNESFSSIVYAESAWLHRDLNQVVLEKTDWENYLKIDPHGGFSEQAHTRLIELKSH